VNRGQLRDPARWLTHPCEALARLSRVRPVIWYGSRARGVDDAAADVDLWMLVSEDEREAVRTAAGTLFFPLTVDGVTGHVTVKTTDELAAAFAGPCDLPMIFELRHAMLVQDEHAAAQGLLDRAKRPMPEAVRRAWFMHHYVEMRGEHRAADSPMRRGDAMAVLLAVARTLEQAMRASIVLGGEPYPYHKWLRTRLDDRPIAATVDRVLACIEAGWTRRAGDENDNAITADLRAIRAVLVDGAKSNGVDEPWLDRWWYHIDAARRVVSDASWS